MPMYDLVKPSGWGKGGSGPGTSSSSSSTSPYKHFSWSSGNLLFEYLRYDRVPYGSAGDLGNFQVNMLFYGIYLLLSF